jgi:hypothetical protein
MNTATIESIVIVSNPHGHIASLRFSDPSLDADIAATYKDKLYDDIERFIIRTARVRY